MQGLFELKYATDVSGEVELWFRQVPDPPPRQLVLGLADYFRYPTGVPVAEFDREFPFKYGQIFGHFQNIRLEMAAFRSGQLQPGDVMMAGGQDGAMALGVITLMDYQNVQPEWPYRRTHLRDNWYALDLGLISFS